MFDLIERKLQKSFKKFQAKTVLQEEDIIEVIQDIKIALLEADVNFKVVKKFINDVKAKALNSQITSKLNSQHFFIKLVKEELVNILGKQDNTINIINNPEVIMMVGLQGMGKTTTTAKLASFFRKKQKIKNPLMVAADTYRPAAIDQLVTLGKELNIDVFAKGNKLKPVEIAKQSLEWGIENKNKLILIDTAGRLSINEELMTELKEIKKVTRPKYIIFVVDAFAGQEIINVAKAFDDVLKLSGIIITKTDSDTRGGAALSIVSLLNIPIYFLGTGEKINNLEMFHPERMANRILGMGDILTLIEKTEETIDKKQSKKWVNRLFSGQFNLDDLMQQLMQMKKLGKMSKIVKLIPGLSNKIDDAKFKSAERKIKIFEILISSMTKEERKNPKLLKNVTRKNRIIKGSGKTNQDYNLLINEFERMSKQLKDVVKSVKDKNLNLKF